VRGGSSVFLTSLVVALCIGLTSASEANAQGVAVGAPYEQTRTSSFTYYVAADGVKQGLLKSERIEPDDAQSCVVTSYTYDGYGNKTGATTAGCSGATGRAVFDSRSSTSTYASLGVTVKGVSITLPGGTYATSAANAVGHGETRSYDPRFGVVIKVTGPNGLVTSWEVDDLGRKTKEVRADGTASVTYYCYLSGKVSSTDANSPGCHNGSSPVADVPAPRTTGGTEAPADAVMYVQTHNLSSAGAKNGPFTRIYTDAAGRKLRSVRQAYDGPGQVGDSSRLIVQDSEYSPYGVQTIATQPYYLDSGSSTAAGVADHGMTLTEVDVLGRPTVIHTADPQGEFGNQSFGDRGSRRVARTTNTYSGLSVTTTNDKGQTRTEEKNIDGLIVRITDALGAQLVHQHDAFGNLVKTKDALGNTTTIAYDRRGRKVSLNDPDAGLTKYDYNALGELVWQQNAKQYDATPATQTMLAYDKLGRMISRGEPEYTSTWSYDTCANGKGKLCQTSTTTGIARTFVYDDLGRPINTRLTVTGGPSLASAVEYDSTHGRVKSQTYPSGLQVSPVYTGNGHIRCLKLGPATASTSCATSPPGASANLAQGSLLWRGDSYNAWGKPEKQVYGNTVVANSAVDASQGRPTNLTAGIGGATDVVDLDYSWNSLGQLEQRNDGNGDGSSGAGSGAVSDSYAYDAIGRLQGYTVAAPAIPNLARAVTLQYNALGMLLYKSDVGVYTYPAQGGVRPHALLSMAGAVTTSYGYDSNGNLTSASAGKYRSIAYTSFNLPDSQTGMQGPGGTPKYTWVYDENHQRIKETRVNAAGTRTTWMLHPDNQGGLGFECDSATHLSCGSTNTNQRHYISAGGSVIGVLISTGALPTLTATQTAPLPNTSLTLVKVEYWHQDHLGSLVATTDQTGGVTARYAYDPFGKRRFTSGTYDAMGTLVVDWASNNTGGATDRGYTGHEHLDEIGVIHMNGRIFDPTLGRFLQADPLIQDATNLQNFDRYAYCMNNPLICTDPSGHSWLSRAWHKVWRNEDFRIVASIAVAAYLGPIGSGLASLTGNVVAQSAIAGFASGAIATGDIKGALQGAFSAAMFAGAGNVIAGGDFFTNAPASGSNPYAGVGGSKVAAVAVHGVVGCVTSAAGGGKCGPGALSAAFAKTISVNGITEAAGGIGGMVVSAVAGGTASVLGGGKFANGAQTGAFSYLFNELAHQTTKAQRGYGESAWDRDQAMEQYRSGAGGVIRIDIDTLDFGGLTDSGWDSNNRKTFTFRDKQDYGVHGTVTIQKMDTDTFTVLPETYNNDHKQSLSVVHPRNVATAINRWLHGPGQPFSFEFDGARRLEKLGRGP
jgi:RHS repeat-associated protein